MPEHSGNDEWLIQGTRLSFPIRVDDATTAMIIYTVSARKAALLLRDSGLQPLSLLGRSILTLACVDYRRSTLGTYFEVGAALLSKAPDGTVGPCIVDLPVTESFTCEAGKAIWHLPKWIADIDLVTDGPAGKCWLSDRTSGETIIETRWRTWIPRIPLSTSSTVSGLTPLAGQIELSPSVTHLKGIRLQLGGSRPVVGNHHAMAQMLRDLGLPRRPLATVVLDGVSIDLEPPVALQSPRTS